MKAKVSKRSSLTSKEMQPHDAAKRQYLSETKRMLRFSALRPTKMQAAQVKVKKIQFVTQTCRQAQGKFEGRTLI